MEEAWFLSALGGQPLGYTHEVVRRNADGTYVTTAESRLTMQRGGEVVSVWATERWTETADALPVDYSATIGLASTATEIRLTTRATTVHPMRTGSARRIQRIAMPTGT